MNEPKIATANYAIDYHPVALDGHRFFVPGYAAHRPACLKLLNGQYYEPATHRLMARLLAGRDGDLVHAGTFFGDMLPSFAAACRGRVYAFEPVLENYILAKLCLFENDIDTVVIFNAGLGEAIGVAHVDTGGGKEHLGGASRIADTGQVTSVMTVDGLGIERLAVLQLDVEGFELCSLRGAAETIARCRPVIMIEDNEKACAPFLESHGYRLAGEIPGLKIWSDPGETAALRADIEAVTS